LPLVLDARIAVPAAFAIHVPSPRAVAANVQISAILMLRAFDHSPIH
jgi:hypothetical protein